MASQRRASLQLNEYTIPSMKAALYSGRDNNDPCMQYTHAVCSKSLLFLPPIHTHQMRQSGIYHHHRCALSELRGPVQKYEIISPPYLPCMKLSSYTVMSTCGTVICFNTACLHCSVRIASVRAFYSYRLANKRIVEHSLNSATSRMTFVFII